MFENTGILAQEILKRPGESGLKSWLHYWHSSPDTLFYSISSHTISMAYRLLTTGIPNQEPLLFKSGTATITAGNTSVVVNHEMEVLPERIEVVPDAIISNVNDVSFTISILYSQASNVSFNWHASPTAQYLNTGDLDGGSP